MANTKAVYARIDTKLKENAEGILQQLGISPSSAIQMLYSQIVRTNGFPLDLHLSYQVPTAIGNDAAIIMQYVDEPMEKIKDFLESTG